MMQIRVLFFSLSFFTSAWALAFPLPQGDFASLSFHTEVNTDYDFEGIVALSNCSGSLVQFENSKDSDQALMFTNGHCVEFGFPKPGQILKNQNSSRRVNLMNSKAQLAGTVKAVRLLYATMTSTDLAIYQLQETYSQIKEKFHVSPLVLSATHPQLAMPIEVISGYWRKGYSCSIEAFIPQLIEEGYHFADSIRYSRPGCETIGGTSGSPIVLSGTRDMVGINNTGNEDGQECTMNNPCEVDSEGNVSFEKGLSYAQQTFWVYSCLNAENKLDLNQAGCQLPK